MPLLDKPEYPVIDSDPSWGRVFSNMNIGDITDIVGFSGAGFAVGFFGSSKKLRVPNSKFNAGIGLMAGIMYASLSSTQRLIGVSPKHREVLKYGAQPKAEIEAYNYRAARPNIELIDDGFGKQAK